MRLTALIFLGLTRLRVCIAQGLALHVGFRQRHALMLPQVLSPGLHEEPFEQALGVARILVYVLRFPRRSSMARMGQT